MTKLLLAVAFPLVVLLSACGPNNPLIGTWESDPVMGISNTVEFTSSTMIGGSSMGGVSNKSEIKVKDYKVSKNDVAVTLEQNGSTVTMDFILVDADTIEQDLGLVKMRYHRKK